MAAVATRGHARPHTSPAPAAVLHVELEIKHGHARLRWCDYDRGWHPLAFQIRTPRFNHHFHLTRVTVIVTVRVTVTQVCCRRLYEASDALLGLP